MIVADVDRRASMVGAVEDANVGDQEVTREHR
jgi:hypothetical protein